MKYKNVNKRLIWEMSLRRNQPDSKTNYYLSESIRKLQDDMEKKIEQYRNEGRKLTKKMRSYVRSKSRS